MVLRILTQKSTPESTTGGPNNNKRSFRAKDKKGKGKGNDVQASSPVVLVPEVCSVYCYNSSWFVKKCIPHLQIWRG